eukprot:jgi/Botrbrau1/10428/Bobra.0133s0035.1
MNTALSPRYVFANCRPLKSSPSGVSGVLALPYRPASGRQHRLAWQSIKAAASKDAPQTVEGAMTEVLIASIKAKISEALQTENVSVRDMRGDGRHVEIDVVSKLFEGQSTMQRQRMVYKSIWLELQDSVHAVDAMTTKTPSEAGL